LVISDSKWELLDTVLKKSILILSQLFSCHQHLNHIHFYPFTLHPHKLVERWSFINMITFVNYDPVNQWTEFPSSSQIQILQSIGFCLLGLLIKDCCLIVLTESHLWFCRQFQVLSFKDKSFETPPSAVLNDMYIGKTIILWITVETNW
jgi:hypothetical protein